ncbi:hypothetical protein HIC20_00665 [Buchnera aphidicola (Hormaphis cornu)]|nr:hypothetical protein HIC20_00665 [Buchnera aphidicola (Hormaphis cornu)]
MNHKYFPINNTFICPVPLINNTGLIWNDSYCYSKIKKILWIPILKKKTSSLKYFKILKPFLWSPSSEDMKILKKDWEEFMDLIILGNFKKITSEFGQFLHICIKSKNKNILTKAIGNLGEYTKTNPISFYFRKKFVLSILKKYSFNF